MAQQAIILKGRGIRKELVANATITPGHLVERMTTSKLRVHAAAGGHAQKAFAIEDDLQGNDIADNYSAADLVQFEVMERGSEVYALLANGQSVAIGDPLESAGDGTLQKHTAQTEALGADSSANIGTINVNCIVAYALEAVDMSGSSAADPSGRIKVEVA